MSGSRTAPSSERMRMLLAEQAAEWVLRLQEAGASAEDRAEFAAWVRVSPERVQEFLNAQATWEALSGEALRALPDRKALMEIAGGAGAEVVEIGLRKSRIQLPTARVPRRALLAAALSAVVIGGLLGGGLWAVGRYGNHADFATGVGEQETYTLRDGSRVALNTRSQVRLDWSDEFRDVYLESGEVLFDVTKDPSRPFRVWAGSSMVRAVGTKFNVYRAGDAVTVTVLEGKVEVTPGEGGATGSGASAAPVAAIALAVGEQARIQKSAAPVARKLEKPEKAVAWQERRLEFESAPLSEVIAEFNRYHEIPLVLEDPALGAKRINGSFDASDRASLVGFLEEFENVEIEARDDAVLVRAR